MNNKTFAEPVEKNISDIKSRLLLLSLTKKDFNFLTDQQFFIKEKIDVIVDEFYKNQMEHEEISLLLSGEGTIDRLKVSQRKYILDLFLGQYDNDYVNNRLRIGMVHKKIGVEPKLYLSAALTLKNIIINQLKNKIKQQPVLDATVVALDKLFYFDTTLIMDTYIGSLVGEIQADKKKLEIYAQLDSLTNLYNQGAMKEFLEREILIAKRNHKKLSLVYFDLDNFKEINDNLGHIKGDEVLNNIGSLLLKDVRETDMACRYGGDEFCIVLPNCTVNNAQKLCKKIIKSFSELYPEYSISIGIAETGTDHYCDGQELIKKADKFMYLAKQQAGSQICC